MASQNTATLTATGQVAVGSGEVERIIVSASSSGVIKLIDSPNSAIGRVILDNLSVSAGNNIELNFPYFEGLHFVLVSGTASLQLGYSPSKF